MFEPMDNAPPVATQTTRTFLQLVIVMAFVGFFIGIRQLAPLDLADSQSNPAAIEIGPVAVHDQTTPKAVPSTSYGKFDRRELGPNHAWTNELGKLKQSELNLMAEFAEDSVREDNANAQAAYLQVRAQRRAFDGAPPVVPHPIDQLTTSSCIVCHEKGKDIGKGVRAPMIPHPMYVNCTQCHAEGASTEFVHEPLAENRFVGLLSYGAGSRAGVDAPPVIPHSTWMRENCLSCHSRQGASPIRTTHPWRANCTQCHAPSAELDQLFTDMVKATGAQTLKTPSPINETLSQ